MSETTLTSPSTISPLQSMLHELYSLRELFTAPAFGAFSGYTGSAPKITWDASFNATLAAGLVIGTNIGGISTGAAYTLGANPIASITTGAYLSVYGSTHATPNLLIFGRNSIESARFDANGFLNIGAAGGWTGGFENLFVKSTQETGRTLSAWNSHNSAGSAILARVDNTATRLAEFYYTGATSVGTITTNGTTTTYGTTSDERLKENIADAGDSGAAIDAIQVRTFDWKASGEHVAHGFVAQELHAVVPDAVVAGGDDENTAPWNVDPSKLVALLVKEVQSLRARLAALETAP